MSKCENCTTLKKELDFKLRIAREAFEGLEAERDEYKGMLERGLTYTTLQRKYGQLEAELAAFRWIPVSEPPKEDGHIWIGYSNNGYTYLGYYQPKYKLWQIFNYCGGYKDVSRDRSPSHWMPIPPLPEKAKPQSKFDADDPKYKLGGQSHENKI